MADPTVNDLERIFHEALGCGDVHGVESALTLLAVRDPRRAQTLMDRAQVALRIAIDLRDADPDLRAAIGDGNTRFVALVNAYRGAKAAVGAAEALTGLFSTLTNDTDPAVVVAMLAVAVVVRVEEASDG